MAGTSAAASSATGALVGSGALTGAAVAASVATGTLVGFGVLAGASAATSTATGSFNTKAWVFTPGRIVYVAADGPTNFAAPPYIPSYAALGPSDDDDFLQDWSAKLDGATIATIANITTTPAGLTIAMPTVFAGAAGAASAVAFTASAGTPSAPGTVGVSYTVSASIVTSDGRDLTRSAIVPVQNR